MQDDKDLVAEFKKSIQDLNQVMVKARNAGLQADVKVIDHGTVGSLVSQKIISGTLSRVISEIS